MKYLKKGHSDTKYNRNMNGGGQEDARLENEKISEDAAVLSPDIDEEDEVILPPLPEEKSYMGKIQDIVYWGFSQRGESHIKSGLPCQDRCKILVSNGTRPVIIAAIADGVGSCALSHYGASIATEKATALLKEKLDSHPNRKLEDEMIKNLLCDAMQCAYDAVAKAAEEMEQLEYSFQSTLTIALYDGNMLYISHSGDGGVVVIVEDGKMKLVTPRMKGEEATSVYPLQAGPQYWKIIKVGQRVKGFVMATDGVLDAFVRGEKEGDRIYYPFIQPAFEAKQKSEKDVKEVLEFYYNYMRGEEYRKSVTDDLTMVVISNRHRLSNKDFPEFNEKEWEVKTKEYQMKVRAALYPDTAESDREKEIDKENEMLFCPNCGNQVDKKNNFCPDCGKKLRDTIDKKSAEKKEIQIPQSRMSEKAANSRSHNGHTDQRSRYSDCEIVDKINNSAGIKIVVGIIVAILLIILGILAFKLAIRLLFKLIFWW